MGDENGKNGRDIRRHFSPEQKFRIVKEQLTTKTPVSEICKKYGISSGLFYRWQEQFFSAALEGFRQLKNGPSKAELRKIAELEKDNFRMKGVIAEITSENIALKKTLVE